MPDNQLNLYKELHNARVGLETKWLKDCDTGVGGVITQISQFTITPNRWNLYNMSYYKTAIALRIHNCNTILLPLKVVKKPNRWCPPAEE